MVKIFVEAKLSRIFLLSVIFCLPVSLVFAGYGVGQKQFVFEDKARNRRIETFVWYPTAAEAKTEIVKEPGPFETIHVAKMAEVVRSKQKFPIVLLSHGSGGSANRLFWLAKFLVQNGIVVIAVNHPGNMIRDNSGDGLMQVWKRPQDLIAALNQTLGMAEFQDRLDTSRIGAIGHSAGGTTALLLGGARLSKTQFTSPIPNCAGTADPFYAKLCQQIKSTDLNSFPTEVVEADYSDSRIKAVVALDPGFAKSLNPQSLKKIQDKSWIVIAENLLKAEDEIFSKDFLKILPPPASEVMKGSSHMTFLSACKMPLPGDDPEIKELCAGNAERIRLQKETAQKTLAFLQHRWK